MSAAPEIQTPVRLALTRRFDAAPESLFDAWLSDGWGNWLGTKDVICLACEVDPRVGGRYRIVSRMPDGREIEHIGVYKEISRPSRLVFTWTPCSGTELTTVTLTFKPRGGGTELTLQHEGFLSEETKTGHNGGWNATFDRLEAYLAA